jgi:L-fuculose-phosphate aldolase
VTDSQLQSAGPLRARLQGLCGQIVQHRLTGPLASGNASIYDRATGLLVVTPTAVAFDKVSEESVAVCRVDRQLDALETIEGEPSSELRLHVVAYRESLQAASCVLHLHSDWIVAASCLDHKRLPFIHYHQALLGSKLTPVVPYASPGSVRLAESVGAAVASTGLKAVLLGNHGAVVLGVDEHEALEMGSLLEDVCRLVVTVGDRGRELPTSELISLRRLFRTYGRS